MRKILIIVLAVVLALALSLTSVTFAAGGKKEVNLAQEAGQAWLDSTVAVIGEPVEWVGARLTTPQVYYDLKGNPDAYMFAIESNGEVVGYIIVGSSDYGYDMFEAAADVPPLSIPSADEVKSTLKRDLGLDVASIGRPTRLLYLGFDNVFAVYQAGGQEVAVDLKFDFAMPASNLTAIVPMPSPKEYKANMEAADQAKREELADSIPTAQTLSYYWLTMYHWCNDYCADCNPDNYCWCGPSSGVSIGRYYKEQRGYTRLPDAGPEQCQMYLRLFTTMGTSCTTGGTTTTNYGPGFVAMTKDPNGDGNPSDGYGNTFSHVTVKYPSNYYPTIKNYINSGWPTALRAYRFYDDITGNPDFPPSAAHYVAIKGYYDNFLWNNHVYERVLICTDSDSRADWLYLNYGILGLYPWYITI